MLRVRAQLLNFIGGQFAPLTCGQITERDRAFAHPDQPSDMVAKQPGNVPYLTFAPFAHDNAHPGAVVGSFQYFDPGWQGHFAVKLHPFPPLAQILDRWRAIEQHAVLFFHLEARMSQTIRQIAVVGE